MGGQLNGRYVKKEGWIPEFDDHPDNTLISETDIPEARSEVGGRLAQGWQLVTGLTAREGHAVEKKPSSAQAGCAGIGIVHAGLTASPQTVIGDEPMLEELAF